MLRIRYHAVTQSPCTPRNRAPAPQKNRAGFSGWRTHDINSHSESNMAELEQLCTRFPPTPVTRKCLRQGVRANIAYHDHLPHPPWQRGTRSALGTKRSSLWQMYLSLKYTIAQSWVCVGRSNDRGRPSGVDGYDPVLSLGPGGSSAEPLRAGAGDADGAEVAGSAGFEKSTVARNRNGTIRPSLAPGTNLQSARDFRAYGFNRRSDDFVTIGSTIQPFSSTVKDTSTVPVTPARTRAGGSTGGFWEIICGRILPGTFPSPLSAPKTDVAAKTKSAVTAT